MKPAVLISLLSGPLLVALSTSSYGSPPGLRATVQPSHDAGVVQPFQSTFHFADVTLTDGSAVYRHAEIHVRVRSSAGGGYTRADYFDQEGRRLGFYEAFEVVSLEEAVLRGWALRNFADRTTDGG